MDLDFAEAYDGDSDNDMMYDDDEDQARMAQQEHEAMIKQRIDHLIEVDVWSTGMLQKTTHQQIERFIQDPQRVLGWKRLDTRLMHQAVDRRQLRYLAQLLHEIMGASTNANLVLDQWLFRQWRKNFFNGQEVLR